MPSFDQNSVSLSKDQLQAFNGFYTSERHSLDITIKYKKGDLMAQATGQRAFPLTSISDTSFKYVPTGIKMRFEASEGDQLKRFYLLQAGRKFLFKQKEEKKEEN